MKFVYPEIETVFDTSNGMYNTLIIENQALLCRLIEDLSSQLEGYDGKSVISRGDTILQASKSAELIDRFIPFDLNKKTLLNKLMSSLEHTASEAEYFEQTASVLSKVESYLNELSFSLPCDVDFGSISVGSLIKACAPRIHDDAASLAERILDYMELVTEFEGCKLFFTLNMRAFITDADMELFAKSAIEHGYHVIGIESTALKTLSLERRTIIDSDLCEIG